MEVINDPKMNEEFQKFKNNNRSGRIFAGFFLIVIGGVLLAGKLGVYIPHWVFTWQFLLIAIGVFMGFRSMFRNTGWMVPILIGGVFMMDEFYPGIELKRYLLPSVIIVIGLMMIIAKRPSHRRRFQRCNGNFEYRNRFSSRFEHVEDKSTGDFIDANAIFGGMKKIVMSKNFKGGELNCFCGGAEINLMNADINGSAKLEINNVFGGTRLIVPANWEIKSEMTAVLGGIEDKRQIQHGVTPDPNKVLLLEGNCVFGGIDIRTY